ncbi:MAG: ribosomal protein S18-alanine N-acetyltransferase [Tardiphaga sp.]
MPGWWSRLFGRGKPVVEPATLRDVAALAGLHAASFHRGWGEAEFDQMLRDGNTLVHRLRLHGRVIGFAVSRIAADEAEVLSVAVAPKCRGRGLSRDLFLTQLGHLAGRGVKTVFLEVEENNAPARRLYERSGFVMVGRRERYYKEANGVEMNALVMRRDLS